MNAVEVSTVVHADRAAIYDFLVDFEGYAKYSEYVEDVTRTGDGGPGTEYAITVSWWELGHTAESVVTATEPPDRIDWRLAGNLDASGHWRIEDVSSETESVSDEDAPSNRVVLRIEYDPDSVSGSSLSLPAFVPLDALVDRVAPHVESEAESIVADVVADLEGQRRDVTLTVHETPENV